MMITTTDHRIDKILSSICLQMPDGSGYSAATLSATHLRNLCAVLTKPEHAGNWSVSFADQRPTNWRYADLLESLDDATEQAFLLAPGYIGADSEDLIYWLEEVYSQPVTMDNYGRVAQLFRLWYAATHLDEYHNPPDSPPTKFAEMSLAETPEARKDRNRRLQTNRTERLKAAAQRLGFATIDQLSGAILGADDGQIQRMTAALRRS